MVLNAAVQMLREADELKQQILKFKIGTSMLQERNLWTLQQQLQKIYQKVLVLDLDYALDKKVEQDLWNIGFKQQIDALQSISRDRKNPLRSEGQAMLSWVLQAASGFYLCLLHQLCTSLKLDLPFRRRASLLGNVEGWGGACVAGGGRPAAAAAARYVTQHCLVHLGDLARYSNQLHRAHTFYRHALVISAHSGQPYNQLGLVALRARGGGRARLAALYWHVRAVLVRAPFPPAPNNLANTLQPRDSTDLPVLPGITSEKPRNIVTTRRLDANSYAEEFLRALQLIYSMDDLDEAEKLVGALNDSLITLVATDSFDSMTLIRMACIIMWLIEWSSEHLSAEESQCAGEEARAARAARGLAAGAVRALLLPSYTCDAPKPNALPALKIWLMYLCAHPGVLGSAAFSSRRELWPALAHTLNALTPAPAPEHTPTADTVPLAEDVEVHGFVPLQPALAGLQFAENAIWDTYRSTHADSLTDTDSTPSVPVSCGGGSAAAAAADGVRARRLLRLGAQLADLLPQVLSVSITDSKYTFTSSCNGGAQLTEALAALQLCREGKGEGSGVIEEEAEEGESGSEEDPPPPKVISEADFREKVREKRVGILKPQGSLERAREERAATATVGTATQPDHQEAEVVEEPSKSEEGKREAARKPRMNVAMAAILRKQEETNKQVKFVTPPPTPDSTGDPEPAKGEKPKVVQPKAIKSLANLPVGKKTGGILSLKDKSAGYPHLVNAEPEKKPENEENAIPSNQFTKPEQHWNAPPPAQEPIRPNFQHKNTYGIQNTGLHYNPNYQPSSSGHGIKLPVVNPKEIDVRSAALLKASSRQDVQPDRFMYQLSSDKKNFLNDLPPRFANQYRYWQTAQENQDAKREEFKTNPVNPGNQNPGLFSNVGQQQRWSLGSQQPPAPWWQPDRPPLNFAAPNFQQPQMNNFYNPNPYQNIQNLNYNTQEQSYMQPPTLQGLVSSPNFNSSLNNFGNYAPQVGYDASMYPQFSELSFPPPEKPPTQFNKDLMGVGGIGFGSPLDLQRSTMNVNMNEPAGSELKNTDHLSSMGNTYSLFSGAPQAPWGQAAGQGGQAPRHQQSLWSGPGPSPLERLLEQQKQKQPSSEPH